MQPVLLRIEEVMGLSENLECAGEEAILGEKRRCRSCPVPVRGQDSKPRTDRTK